MQLRFSPRLLLPGQWDGRQKLAENFGRRPGVSEERCPPCRAKARRATAEAPLPGRTTPPPGKRTAKCGVYPAVRVVSWFFLLGLAGALRARDLSDWTRPIQPYHVAGHTYYVGTQGLAVFLVVTPGGHILINSTLESNVPLIRDSVGKLGFKFRDIKVLLISHAHWDHCAGSAAVVQATGAKYMVMDADVPVVESGGKTDFQYANDPADRYPAVKVDRVLHDGDQVTLGGITLTARKTPGHTKGCTTWTWTEVEAGQNLHVVVVGSPNVNPGYKLVGNRLYPEIAPDYDTTFRVLKSLPCDIFLGAHGGYYEMTGKIARMGQSGLNPFIDPEGYKLYVAERERAFRKELARQTR